MFLGSFISNHHSAKFTPLLSSCNVTLAFLSHVYHYTPLSSLFFSCWLPIDSSLILSGLKFLHRLSFINHSITFFFGLITAMPLYLLDVCSLSLSFFFFPLLYLATIDSTSVPLTVHYYATYYNNNKKPPLFINRSLDGLFRLLSLSVSCIP